MRLDINLASHPYEDARQFWTRWGTAVGAMGLVTLALITMDISGFLNSRRDRAEISKTQALIAHRDEDRAKAEAFLNQPENRTTRDQSQFLNQLIERKAFSWTRVLESLEKVMPPRVHLVSIAPELDDDNQLSLKMLVAGDSRERAIELAKRMEESHRFAQTHITSENYSLSQNGDNEKVEIVAIYIPEPVAELSKPDKGPKQATEGSSKKDTEKKSKTGSPKVQLAKRSKR